MPMGNELSGSSKRVVSVLIERFDVSLKNKLCSTHKSGALLPLHSAEVLLSL